MLHSYWLSNSNDTSGEKGDPARRKQNKFSAALHVAEALRNFQYDSLKVEQIECLRREICSCEDVLAVLPTGFGKSSIYQVIPKVLECLENKSDDTTASSRLSRSAQVTFNSNKDFLARDRELPSFLFLLFLQLLNNILRLLWIWCRTAWRTTYM